MIARTRRPARAVALCGVLAAGCVTGGYQHESRDEPLAEAALEGLHPGVDDLTKCLHALGAPHRVFEYRGDGAALLWYWQDAAGWGLSISSGRDEVPGSFQFDFADQELPATVLWFGPDLVLERWRRGTIGELLPGRVRPASPGSP